MPNTVERKVVKIDTTYYISLPKYWMDGRIKDGSLTPCTNKTGKVGYRVKLTISDNTIIVSPIKKTNISINS